VKQSEINNKYLFSKEESENGSRMSIYNLSNEEPEL